MSRQCERCGRTSQLRTLLMSLSMEDDPAGVISQKSVLIHGAKLEVCGACHDQWLASVQTWFENASVIAPEEAS